MPKSYKESSVPARTLRQTTFYDFFRGGVLFFLLTFPNFVKVYQINQNTNHI